MGRGMAAACGNGDRRHYHQRAADGDSAGRIGAGIFFSEAPLWLAIAVVLLPRVFGTMRALLDQLYSSSALLAARARGAGPAVLAWRYVALPALPQFMALAGVTLALGFGAIIPIEALCDVPGVGQLFWKAALARDLTLLCGLGLIITFVIAAVRRRRI